MHFWLHSVSEVCELRHVKCAVTGMLWSSNILYSAGAAVTELRQNCESATPEHSDGEGEVHMSKVCPLDDDLLPIAADGLRLKQARFSHTRPFHMHKA